jgi:hypothetical protein
MESDLRQPGPFEGSLECPDDVTSAVGLPRPRREHVGQTGLEPQSRSTRLVRLKSGDNTVGHGEETMTLRALGVHQLQFAVEVRLHLLAHSDRSFGEVHRRALSTWLRPMRNLCIVLCIRAKVVGLMASAREFSVFKKREPPRGFEPRTDGLRNHCSTAELRRLASARLLYGSRSSERGAQAVTAARSRRPALRITSSPFSTSTRTVSPSPNLPSRMARASGSWIRRWITRFSGRAP